MPYLSLLDFSEITLNEINHLFLECDQNSQPSNKNDSKNGTKNFIKKSIEKSIEPKTSNLNFNQIAGLIFFESSTRTRMSFEMACVMEGYYPTIFDSVSGTSLEKGETLEDTVLNIAAMEPQFLVIRAPQSLDLRKIEKQISIPIINAGWGVVGHPTQALLDAYTIYQERRSLAQEKLLIVGDIKHSRVASSHIQLSKILGYELAFCGPEEFVEDINGIRKFNSLMDGLEWATAVLTLRVQNERHTQKTTFKNYNEEFGLNSKNLKSLRQETIILHPGPVNHGVEMESIVFNDHRCRVFKQVKNGVLIRRALIRNLFSGVQ